MHPAVCRTNVPSYSVANRSYAKSWQACCRVLDECGLIETHASLLQYATLKEAMLGKKDPLERVQGWPPGGGWVVFEGGEMDG